MPKQVKDLSATLEVAVHVRARLGEGPIWDDRAGDLIFVDCEESRIYRFDPAAKHLSYVTVGPIIGAAIPREAGGIVASSVEGLLAVQPHGECQLLVPVERDRPYCRMNDAKCDSRGRLFTGTFASPFERGGNALYRIDPDGSLHLMLSGVTVSNGIGWSPDERTFYYVDTATRGIDCFDYDIGSGAISRRRRFVDIDRAHGFPDGLCVDAEGYVWIALFLGGAVRRYAPDGQLVAQVALPVSGVTSCNFGGAALDELYVTTARNHVPTELLAGEPLSGALFRCRPGVTGQASHRFAG